MCRVLAYVLMLCLILPLPVLSAPNPNENALENASENARFNREDGVQRGMRDQNSGDDGPGRWGKMFDDDDDLDKGERYGKKERDGKKSKGGKNKKK